MPELLAGHTTLRLGGPARRWVEAGTEEQLLDEVARADTDRTPVLVLGGGSNLVVADAGFPGTVVHVGTQGVLPDVEAEAAAPTCGGLLITVAAGESWDELVATAVRRGWVGIEALAGIPGSVGATPIQNVGAYGQEVAQTVASVRIWDRRERRIRTLAAAECDFGYRSSRFKADPEGAVVLSVQFQLLSGALSAPVAYAELARALGIEPGERAPLADVRAAVLDLRRRKGMVLEPEDHDTWSAGSFFTNPVLDPDQVPPGAPSWPVEGSQLVKTSAAWLIDHAGYGKGYGPTHGRVSLSTKHPLALTNRGDASTEDLLALAREVRDGVARTYGGRLINEPGLVGCAL